MKIKIFVHIHIYIHINNLRWHLRIINHPMRAATNHPVRSSTDYPLIADANHPIKAAPPSDPTRTVEAQEKLHILLWGGYD